ncbi:unnamed protein product, partial [Urochloa humidicola]
SSKRIPKSQSTRRHEPATIPRAHASPRRRSAPPIPSTPRIPTGSPPAPAKKMHLWPSLRIRDSFKHGYLQKLELNLGHMKRAQRQGQGQKGEGQEDQDGQSSDGKAPLLQDHSPSGSVLAGALERAWDAVLLFTCCCCCFCCGACSDEEDHPTAR